MTLKKSSDTCAGRATIEMGKPISSLPDHVFGAVECLAEMERHGMAWHSLIAELLSGQPTDETNSAPLSDWAVAVLRRYEQAAWDSYQGMFVVLRTYLQTAAGLPPDCVYEIWTGNGVRLDGQFQFVEHAASALQEHRKSFPDAFILQMNVGASVVDDLPADDLLPTLLGEVRYLQTRVHTRSGERHHVIRDATGRAISVTTSALIRSDAFSRMGELGRKAVTSVTN